MVGKRILSVIMFVILLCSLMICTTGVRIRYPLCEMFESTKPYHVYEGRDYLSYESLLKNKKQTMELPFNFVSALALVPSGPLTAYRISVPMDEYRGQVYYGKDVVLNYQYEFETKRTETAIYSAVVEIRHCKMEETEATCSTDALAVPSNMYALDAAYQGAEQRICISGVFAKLMYHYDTEGLLRQIQWQDGNRTFTLTVDVLRRWGNGRWTKSESDFEGYEGEDIVAELLNPDTAAGALRKLHIRVALDSISDESYIVFSVCVAVAVVAAWVITYFVMRKKAKNPPRPATCAGIDVPAEDAPSPDGAPDSTPTPPDA